MNQQVFPAIIAKNQKELNVSLKRLEKISKKVHLDVVDNKFAPSSSLQFNFKLKRGFQYNAHLMINHPIPWIKKHGKKMNLCIPHFHALKNPKRYIALTKKLKIPIAFALLPETKVKEVLPYIKDIDSVLLLTVHPGFYGSKFLSSPLKKIALLKRENHLLQVIVDGHMDNKTIKQAVNAGADYFVSGSYIMRSKNPRKAMQELRKALKIGKRK
ncbi:hypothetical protein HOI26_00690 [Candidatus Woesearchaeota archaeon]|jgi:ribulose-phosphate 3-epimerase|nr:hypothetical protein [Candidatus Woesearchaeota archaeon]MBT5739591.1 hypothetical protein [Candidatus Woesearchaeota archaeon]